MKAANLVGKTIALAGLAWLNASPPAWAGPDPLFDGADQFGAGATIPVAWADYDNDGDLDLAVGNYFNQQNELYVNDGAGGFARQAEFGTGNTFALAWADFDNDGDQDLAVGNNGQNWLCISDGAGGFTRENRFGTGRTVALAWGDFDQDGDLDLAVGNGILGVPQQNYLYRNDGGGVFTELPRFGVGQTDSLACADFDNDGDLDLAAGNGGFHSAGQNYLYVNQGDATFTELPRFGLGDSAAVAWADADRDARFDLAVGNWTNGQNYLYLNAGGDTFEERPAFGARDTNTLAWGDFDHDGDLDVAVGNGDFTTADQNYLYVNDGQGTFTERAEFGLGSTDSMAWGDCDNDGDLDLALGNEHSPPQNQLWTNRSDDSAYLQLRLVGQFHNHGPGYSNRDAVGARVAVYAADHLGDPLHLRGCQQVEAKGGFSAQNAIELTFGLPLDDQVDVRINWPGSDGQAITQDLHGVTTAQKLTVVETRPGDIDGDGDVDLSDLATLLAAYGSCAGDPAFNPAADLDGDGCVALADLAILLANYD